MTDIAAEFYGRNAAWHENGAQEPDASAIRERLSGRNERYGALWRHLEANHDLTVLEMGCGNSAVPGILGSMCRDYTVIDIVERRLGSENPKNVHTICANLDHDFPLLDASFDLVIAMMIIEHLYDPFHAFSELARVLKPGGVAYINLPNIAALKCRIDLAMGRMPCTSARDWFERREWDGGHLHYFTVADVKRITGLYGMEVETIHPVGKMPEIKRLMPSLLCHEITYAIRKLAVAAPVSPAK